MAPVPAPPVERSDATTTTPDEERTSEEKDEQGVQCCDAFCETIVERGQGKICKGCKGLIHRDCGDKVKGKHCQRCYLADVREGVPRIKSPPIRPIYTPFIKNGVIKSETEEMPETDIENLKWKERCRRVREMLADNEARNSPGQNGTQQALQDATKVHTETESEA